MPVGSSTSLPLTSWIWPATGVWPGFWSPVLIEKPANSKLRSPNAIFVTLVPFGRVPDSKKTSAPMCRSAASRPRSIRPLARSRRLPNSIDSLVVWLVATSSGFAAKSSTGGSAGAATVLSLDELTSMLSPVAEIVTPSMPISSIASALALSAKKLRGDLTPAATTGLSSASAKLDVLEREADGAGAVVAVRVGLEDAVAVAVGEVRAAGADEDVDVAGADLHALDVDRRRRRRRRGDGRHRRRVDLLERDVAGDVDELADRQRERAERAERLGVEVDRDGRRRRGAVRIRADLDGDRRRARSRSPAATKPAGAVGVAFASLSSSVEVRDRDRRSRRCRPARRCRRPSAR